MKYKVTNTGKAYKILNDNDRTGLGAGETKVIDAGEAPIHFPGCKVEKIKKKKKKGGED